MKIYHLGRNNTGMDDRRKAGFLIFIGGAIFLLGLHMAEILYPGYSVSQNYISDLGVGPEPSAMLFNGSLFLFGLLGLTGSYFLWRDGADRVVPVLLAISSIGAMGVGIFHEYVVAYHNTSALLAFLFAALTALLSYRLVGRPLGYLSAALGLMSMGAIVFANLGYDLGLGVGGIERMILYPAFIWMIGLGALLASRVCVTGSAVTEQAR